MGDVAEADNGHEDEGDSQGVVLCLSDWPSTVLS